ncbi:MAG: YdcF family protein [Clostridia bacterium]|nr:YdcF family protein [Clostridia bacterium]
MKKNIRKKLIFFSVIFACVLVFAILFVALINAFVMLSVDEDIFSPEDFAATDSYDCILVLGAGVRDGRPTDMLRDRLDTAVELYFSGVAKKLLVSGDHGSDDYDEVNVMKDYAVEKGVPSEDIFMDHSGFSTYESIYRADAVFGVKSCIIVTQKYHLFRALYAAEQFGMRAVGVSADVREYSGAFYRETRETLARVQDFFECLFKPLPTCLGDPVDIGGDGNITNDK